MEDHVQFSIRLRQGLGMPRMKPSLSYIVSIIVIVWLLTLGVMISQGYIEFFMAPSPD
jgi:hypothetical protein